MALTVGVCEEQGFFPFNSFNEDGKWGTASEYNANTYLIDEDKINYHFGLSMNLDFKMPETSKSDIIFKFTGDDDCTGYL